MNAADRLRDSSGWRVACAGSAFIKLKGKRLRLVRTLSVVYLVCYLGLAMLCGFARQLAGLKVLGPLNLGYALIFGNYVVAWVLALVYVIAGRRHDVLAGTAIGEHAASRSDVTGSLP